MRFKIKKTAAVLFSLLVPAYVTTTVDSALAFTAGTTSALPWEGPLSSLSAELTGPTASAIAIVAIFVAGLGLIFGEDLGKFARTLLMIVIAISLLIGASKFIPVFTSGGVAF
jgi:type IV secretory pathway VirB2 component (pilin)